MQSLTVIREAAEDDLSIAKIEGDESSPLGRYVFSTQATADIVNKPEVMGMEYTDALEAGVTKFLAGADEFLKLKTTDENTVNVLHFLRGGLNFGIRSALATAYGWNNHRCTFVSSQRDRDENGRWYIKEDSYRKITMAKGSVVFCGDVIATGVTLDSGLQTLTDILQNGDASIKRLVFFTIGCHKAEKVLEKYHKLWSEVFPDFEGTDLIYIEGKFHLADSKTRTTIKLQGTDLLRRDSLLMPDFIKRQEKVPSAALERCTIYDAGSRAFDITEYKEDVIEYWNQVKELAEGGMTALQYLEERYPEASESLRSQIENMSLKDLCDDQLKKF